MLIAEIEGPKRFSPVRSIAPVPVATTFPSTCIRVTTYRPCAIVADITINSMANFFMCVCFLAPAESLTDFRVRRQQILARHPIQRQAFARDGAAIAPSPTGSTELAAHNLPGFHRSPPLFGGGLSVSVRRPARARQRKRILCQSRSRECPAPGEIRKRPARMHFDGSALGAGTCQSSRDFRLVGSRPYLLSFLVSRGVQWRRAFEPRPAGCHDLTTRWSQSSGLLTAIPGVLSTCV